LLIRGNTNLFGRTISAANCSFIALLKKSLIKLKIFSLIYEK